MASAGREFDIVLWGATGYTGTLSCWYLAKTYGLPSDSLKYAIAARTQSRLDELEKKMVELAKAHEKTHGALAVPKIVASLEDEASIVSMCKRAKAVCAFAGPFTKFGEAVVKACAENGVHYTDCCAEFDWVVQMRKVYNAKAVASKAKIVPSCGSMPVPNEAAMIMLHRACKENSLELHSVHQLERFVVKSAFSEGTMNSLFGMFRSVSLKKLADIFFNPFSMCERTPRQAVVDASKMPLLGLSRMKELNMWSSVFPMSPQIGKYLRWSNEVQNFAWGRDVVIKVSALSDTLFEAVSSAIFCWLFPIIMFTLGRLPFLHRFLIQSAGSVSGDDKQKAYFTEVVTIAEAKDQTSNEMKKISLKLNFPFEGYSFTALSVVENALTAVQEETPSIFGVVSPSAALGQSLVNRLEKRGCEFSKVTVT